MWCANVTMHSIYDFSFSIKKLKINVHWITSCSNIAVTSNLLQVLGRFDGHYFRLIRCFRYYHWFVFTAKWRNYITSAWSNSQQFQHSTWPNICKDVCHIISSWSRIPRPTSCNFSQSARFHILSATSVQYLYHLFSRNDMIGLG